HGDVLCAHLAKGNEQIEQLREPPPTSVLFHGPQGYVSPSWYATKQEHGRVVPTWNYVVVQVWGEPLLHDDPEWLRAQIDELTNVAEAQRPEPWKTADAPSDFLTGQLKGIVGVEIPITRIEGKWKVSQNQPDRNAAGVIDGHRSDGLEALAATVANRRSLDRER
ncbi:MAG: FMN-binding negative transcriptional regulator, partial [Sphingomicrobium sp.]